MRFGKVIGNVVLSHHDPGLKGARWLVVAPMGKAQFLNLESDEIGSDPSTVVYDNLGATTGDIIGFTEGGEAMFPFDHPTPVDATNAVIVDQVNMVK